MSPEDCNENEREKTISNDVDDNNGVIILNNTLIKGDY